jgi:hypothetical protein
MAEYLTETAYMRWLKQYFINLQFYFNALENIRVRLAEYGSYPEANTIEERIGEIEQKLEAMVPRNFNIGADPLQGSQKFLENGKVLMNFIFKLLRKDFRFVGIYQAEKNKILNALQEFNFEQRLQEVEGMLETFTGRAGTFVEQNQTLTTE